MKEEILLAINTAFKTAEIALCCGEEKFTAEIDANSKHSENVLKNVDELLQKAGISIADVSVFAVVTGPGSFTGLRIGTAMAKALGCARSDVKFLSLSSLRLLAYKTVKQHKPEGDFICVLDALSNLVFMQQFDRLGAPLSDEKLALRDEILGKEKTCYTLDVKGCNMISLSADDLLEYAEKECKAKKFVGREDMVPKYLRLSQAEANLKKSQEGL